MVLEVSVQDQQAGSLGILKGHLSRANAQWKEFTPEVQALAIFSGAQHYITPNWYPEKQVTARVVPTWNYAVVHAYGFLKIVEDADWLKEHVSGLTDIHEAPSPEPWEVSDAPEDYIRSQLKGIVGLELRIERLEGKWKANQNRSEADRRGVADGLEDLNTPASQAMEAIMRQTLEK
jgi:transcriptional regulator